MAHSKTRRLCCPSFRNQIYYSKTSEGFCAFDAQVNEALEEDYEIETLELITEGKFMDGNMLYALLIKKCDAD